MTIPELTIRLQNPQVCYSSGSNVHTNNRIIPHLHLNESTHWA